MSITVDISAALPNSSGTSGSGAATKIAALQAQLAKVVQAMKDLPSAPGDAKQKEAMNTAYQNQINSIQFQIQAIQDQEAAKAQAAQAAQAAKAQQQQQTQGQDSSPSAAKSAKTPSPGSPGEIIDTYV